MSSLSKRYTLHIATEADNEALRQLYEADDFDGDINVRFLRNPDVFNSLKSEGEKLVVLLLKDAEKNNRTVAMGTCIIRSEYINHEKKRIGYLTGLKIIPGYRKKIQFIPALYAYLHEQTREWVDIYYTTILKDNLIAQKMLEKKRASMPVYQYHNEYTVYLFSPKNSNAPTYNLQQGVTNELKIFYQEHLPTYDFAPSEIEKSNIPEEMFFHLHDPNGEIIAACAVWNQQKEKQYIVSGYKGIYKIAPYLPARLLGYPKFPKKHSACNYLTFAFVRAKNNDAQLAEILIRKTGAQLHQYDFLMLGLHESNPFNHMFKHIKHIKYQSRFYTVNWNAEDTYQPNPNIPIGLEVGLL